MVRTSERHCAKMTNANGDDEEGRSLHVHEEEEELRHDDPMLEDASSDEHHAHDTLAHRKRSHDDAEDDDAVDDETNAKRKRIAGKKNTPPPKKLNLQQWDEMYDRLVEYKSQHGDCLVPKRYAVDPKLGTWVETQRVQWKRLPRTQAEYGEIVTPNKRLNDERLKRLEAIGFAWSAKSVRKTKPASPTESSVPKPKKTSADQAASRAAARQRANDALWNDMYNRLVEYKATYGDCLVPKKYPEDPKLASWVEAQRILHNRDYKPKFKNDPDAMDEAGFVSGTSPPSVAAAMPGVVQAKTPEEWADEMEKTAAHTMEVTELAAMQEAALMDLSHQVAHEVADAAMEVVNEVTAPMLAVGEELTNEEDSKPAAIDTTKKLLRERKEKLEALGFVWSLRTKRVRDHWDDMFHQLVEYKEKHGDCLVPSRYEENFKLGKWVETQRYEYTKLQRATDAERKGEVKAEELDSAKILLNNPRLTEERRRRLELIGFEWKVKNKMKRYYAKQWDIMFDKLLKYKEQHGNCLVPKRYPPDQKLGTWVHTQRIQYRKYMAGSLKEVQEEEVDEVEGIPKGEEEEQNFRLTEDRRRRLDEAGFVWSARETEKTTEPAKASRNSYSDQWNAMFERLEAYKDRHGDCLVPKRYKEDPKLGTWVDTQRVQRKRMLKQEAVQSRKQEDGLDPDATSEKKTVAGRLTDERVSRLERLGFVWSLRDDWTKHYESLKTYKAEYGNCNVPARYAKNRRLGIWVSAQRQQKKIIDAIEVGDENQSRTSTPLTKERIDLLNELGFTWTIRSRDSLGESWNQRLEELKAYKDEHGNCLVPSRYTPNPELGVWVGTQRTQYRLYIKAKEAGKAADMSSAMNEGRIAQLEQLGFVWALRGNPGSFWRKRISEFNEYRQLHGDTAVPSTYKANIKLAAWASSMREQYRLMQSGKPSSLDAEKVAELDSLLFSWDEPLPGEAKVDATDPVQLVCKEVDAPAEAAVPVALTEILAEVTAAALVNMPTEHAEI